MAVTEFYVSDPSLRFYIGTSGDSKPTDGAPTGSRFFETDTYKEYIFDGSAWQLVRKYPTA